MKTGLKKILKAALLLALAGILAIAPALAATPVWTSTYNVTGDQAMIQQLNNLPPFKFAKHKKGIGYGPCPVYTAPSTSAYRTANGRATCATNSAMDEAGFVNGWLLVRYETNKGNYNVGYIPPKYVKNFKSSMGPHFGYIPAVANEAIPITNDPMNHYNTFATLAPGEEFHVISKYNYYADQGLEWWYIECMVDGQVARGFIEIYASFSVGYDAGYGDG